VVKAQAWTTKRAGLGAIRFASTPEEAAAHAAAILGMKIGNFVVTEVLVEEKLPIRQEFYAGVIVDDAARALTAIFSSAGGTGIEEIAREHPESLARIPFDVVEGLADHAARNALRKIGLSGSTLVGAAAALTALARVARKVEARSAEINPLVVLESGAIVAADCRITVDDYAVFRHKELGIEIAREFDRPPTELERIAWKVEEGDYRGTFYFIQLDQGFEKGDGHVGFHGAGGGGSMMSMDALLKEGFRIANFTDTSGNPPASKVYRAARIILSQPGIDGYFASGSGVASQEQFHSARGLLKAFWEIDPGIPAVIRLGGNREERAIAILAEGAPFLSAPLEGFGKDDSADACARRLRELLEGGGKTAGAAPPPTKGRPAPAEPYTFRTSTGEITYDHRACRDCESKVCIKECVPQILKEEKGVPVLAISREEAARGKCTECLACETECVLRGNKGGFISLPIEGLGS
ncbi:MAG TPA: ATP-grasp domain-containing protein, partial [Candidatus Saccharimonadales bacterium]|nr:ATP-grasp domain-containing protein [Candidatus Saccharimonadales bacterium]